MEILGAINHYLYQCMCIGIILFICLEGIQFIFLKKEKRFFHIWHPIFSTHT